MIPYGLPPHRDQAYIKRPLGSGIGRPNSLADVMAVRPRGIDDLERIGGLLCIDFSNTLGWRGTPKTNEWIRDYGDLARWSRKSGILDEEDTTHLLVYAKQHPGQAEQALETARTLRESLYGILSALAHGRTSPKSDLDTLNRMLPVAMGKLQLAPGEESFQWQWQHEVDALDGLLNPVVRSAAELLTSSHVTRLKECANEGCGWIFLDTSRNRSRRWCDMRECGNRVKARRHYRRLKHSETT